MSLFKNELKDIDEKDINLLKCYFNGYDYRGAGYTFISNYIWRTSYCVSWEIIEGYLCLAGARCPDSKEDKVASDVVDGQQESWAYMAMPLIMSKEDAERYDFCRSSYEPESLRAAILECKRRFEEVGRPFVLTSIPGHMLDILREAFPEGSSEIEFIHETEYDEYVYLKEKLIDLSGRALHKKKNHLNFFLRNYEYEAKSISEVDKADILALAAEIRDFKAQDEEEAQDIESEYEAIEQILDLIDNGPDIQHDNPLDEPICVECPIRGVAIYINGKLEAFAIGEIISDTYAAEHFEKANDNFRGLYQLVCREFCKQLPDSIIYVNREEDMGLPGLRQAKEALKPDHMEERYTAEILV